MRTGEAATPPGMRLYAIGDIHGCDDKLKVLHERIAADLAAHPSPDHRIIHIGDYGDRGPNSAGVIARLIGLAGDPHVVCLRGNHDQLWLDFLADPDFSAQMFLRFGGKETLKSYGVGNRAKNYAQLAEMFSAALPEAHRAFLQTLKGSVQFGDYFFAHAGVRPGVPLDQQTPQDLSWIRDEFLADARLRRGDRARPHGDRVAGAGDFSEPHRDRYRRGVWRAADVCGARGARGSVSGGLALGRLTLRWRTPPTIALRWSPLPASRGGIGVWVWLRRDFCSVVGCDRQALAWWLVILRSSLCDAEG
jgi:serine/threonine protein phosphatase 1